MWQPCLCLSKVGWQEPGDGDEEGAKLTLILVDLKALMLSHREKSKLY